MPSNDVELLRYRSQSDLQTSENLRRSTSEGGLSEINPCSNPGLSMLSLSKTRVSVGDNVTVYWDIRGNILCGANDWIGLFELDGPMALSNHLDYKQRGVTIAKRGAIKWAINRDVTLGEVEKKCIFKYIHAPTGCVRAVSPTLYIYNPYAELTAPYSSHRPSLSIPAETLLEFSIAGLQANGLKKNIFGKPSPYVKLSIMPSRRHRRSWKQHHGQIAKTSSQSNTINPKWTSEEFVFLGGPEDLLEVEVRNKFSGARPALSRFLGRLSIPLIDIFECQRSRPEEFTKPLGKRTPADRVQGTITLTITVIVPCAGGPNSTQQENVPPSASGNDASGISSPRNSSQGCVLSNPSLMSSAPNILRPLTLNSSNGVLETVFPVEDHTPSPVSPYAFADQENMNSNLPDSNSRRQPYIRPFSEIYSGEFLPLDIDIQSQGSPQTSGRSQSVNGESEINEGEAINEEGVNEVLQESVELDSADELEAPTVESTRDDTVDIAGNDSGMPLESSQEELENQPMEISEESSEINDSGIAMLTPAIINEEEIVPSNRAERNSVASIELTVDSPLRILEESERVRTEEIALSHENLLQENAVESDDETEEMDTSEAGTVDETDGVQLPTTLTSDSVMEEPTQSSQEGDITPLPTSVNDSYAESHLAASENSLNSSVEQEDLLDVTLSSLSEVEESAQVQPFLEFQPAPSVAEIPIHLGTKERANVGSTEQAQLLERSVSSNPASLSISQPPESLMECLGGATGSSLLEHAERIVSNDSVGGSRTEELSGENGATMPDNSETGSVQSDPNFGASSVTLPMEASEPILLDATSVQTASAAEVLVDTPSAMEVTSSVAHSHSTSSGGRDCGDDILPPRPPRVKRIARSSSDPQSVQAKKYGDRLRNTPGVAAGFTNSPRLARPQLRKRSSEPLQNRLLVSVSGAAAEDVAPTASGRADQNDRMSSGVPAAVADSEPPARESIVMAVPLLSPLRQASSSSETAPVVVANVVPESVAMVTPILSPDVESNRRTTSTNSQSTVVAVPLNPEDSARVAPASTRSHDRSPSDNRDDPVVIGPVQSSQTSSAPSTLQRSDISANAAPLVRRVSDQHRNIPSEDSSSIIYATPLSGHGSEVTAGYSSSFPRQTSFTRVTPLPEGRRRSSCSSGGFIRTVPDSPSVLYRPNCSNPPSTPTSTVAGDTRQVHSLRPDSSSIVTSVAGPSRSGSGASQTLPGPSTSGPSNAPQQRREEIHSLLRTYCAKSLQNPPKSPIPGQPTSASQATSSVGGSEPSRRRTPPGDNQARRSGRRRQGQPVHVSIQDQQEAERNQASHAQDDDPLPSNWERGVDSHGRVYYIDHINRTTTWNRPRRDAPQSESNMNDMNTHWQSLDRRYESFRRTLRGRSSRHSRPPLPAATSRESQTSGEASSSIVVDEVVSPRPSGPSSTAVSSAQGASTPSASSAENFNSSHAPAVKFLTRSDFIDFLKSKGLAGQYYFQSQMLKLIVSKIRADPNTFDKYRHQVELVRFLNQFADPQMEMPPGWDKKVDQNGRLYYINHNSRTTTFIDPRLPLEETTLPRNRAETEPRRPRVPPPRPPPPRTPTRSSSLSGPSTQLTYNQQVVGFLSQPNIDDILKSKYEGYARSPTLKANVRRVQTEGERVLTRLSNNLDFVMLLSVLEESIVSFVPLNAQSGEPTSQPTSPVRELSSPFSGRGGRSRPVSYDPSMKSFMSDSTSSSNSSSSPAPYRRDFEAKVRSFHRQLYHNGYGQGPNKIKLTIRRDHILEDAFDQIMKEPARALRRNRLEIQFTGEEGLDYGGPAREFFFLLSRQLFNPYYGLFEYSANDTYTVQVSPVSLYVDNSHEWFKFCGRIIGLVIIHQHLLDAFFTRPFYKALLRSPCDISDVEALDSLFHQSMTWVMENDITGALDLSFTVSEEIFGQVTERDLVPGGKEIEVNQSNKHEYVEQMVRWRVERGVSEQMESIVNGFSEVLELNLITIFDARELELVISGTAEIDIRDWRKNTEYRSGYHDNHKVVKWFWKAVSSFDNEQKLRLLQFVTGTSSIPYEGFAALRGSTGPRKFCIERWGEYSKLPRAHTCFNRLDLPVYRSYDELLEKLTFAVEESETFAMQ